LSAFSTLRDNETRKDGQEGGIRGREKGAEKWENEEGFRCDGGQLSGKGGAAKEGCGRKKIHKKGGRSVVLRNRETALAGKLGMHLTSSADGSKEQFGCSTQVRPKKARKYIEKKNEKEENVSGAISIRAGGGHNLSGEVESEAKYWGGEKKTKGLRGEEEIRKQEQ